MTRRFLFLYFLFPPFYSFYFNWIIIRCLKVVLYIVKYHFTLYCFLMRSWRRMKQGRNDRLIFVYFFFFYSFVLIELWDIKSKIRVVRYYFVFHLLFNERPNCCRKLKLWYGIRINTLSDLKVILIVLIQSYRMSILWKNNSFVSV